MLCSNYCGLLWRKREGGGEGKDEKRWREKKKEMCILINTCALCFAIGQKEL